MDNKTPWRDVYSAKAWEKILTTTNADKSDDGLAKIGRALLSYHAIAKNAKDKLDGRCLALEQLEQSVDSYLGLASNQGLNKDKDGQKKYDDRRNAGEQLTTKIRPWVVSLGKRCEKIASIFRRSTSTTKEAASHTWAHRVSSCHS